MYIDTVLDVAFSRDGRYLATVAFDCKVNLISLEYI